MEVLENELEASERAVPPDGSQLPGGKQAVSKSQT